MVLQNLFSTLDFSSLFTPEMAGRFLFGLILFIVGFILVKIISLLMVKSLFRRASDQSRMIARKVITYIGIAVVLIIVFSQLGVKVSALLGAAGVVGVAVGIASRTSLGNIISGFFLVSEKAFELGEVITVEDKTGIVISIDLLSVKLRTFDNLLIRIPNEKLISTDITNITRFPIRRMDFALRVAYKEDLERVGEILLSIARGNPLCLDEPAPLLLFKEFGDSGVELLFAVWFEKSNFLGVKNSVFKEIKLRFDEEKIEIPFPHVTLYGGPESKEFPFVMKKDS